MKYRGPHSDPDDHKVYRNIDLSCTIQFVRYHRFLRDNHKDIITTVMTGILQCFEMKLMVPTCVCTTYDNNFAICFTYKNNYADIECFENGEIIGVISDRRQHPMVWTIHNTPESILHAYENISNFMRNSGMVF